MAIDKSNGPFEGRVYLSWTDFVENNPNEGMNVYLSYSDDNGLTWSVPKIVNDDNVPSSHQYYSGIDVNPNGVLCLSWYDRRSDPGDDALTDFYFTLSEDGGNTFANSVKVNSLSSDHNAFTVGLGVGEYVTLAASESFAHLVWADGRNNDDNLNVYWAKINLDNILDVNELSLKPTTSVLALSPNPVSSGEIKIELNLIEPSEIEFSVMTTEGKRVFNSDKKDYLIGDHAIPVALGSLSSGMYLLEVKHKKGTIIRKFMVN